MTTINFTAPAEGWIPAEQPGTMMTLLREGDYLTYRPNMTLQGFPMGPWQSLSDKADELLATLPQDGAGPQVLGEVTTGTDVLPALVRRIAIQIELPSQTLDVTVAQTYYEFTDVKSGAHGTYLLSYSALADDFDDHIDDFQEFATSLELLPDADGSDETDD